jgi:SlyX protein
MTMDLESRVTDLETRLAFQDDTIEALNDVLVEQQRAMQRMQLQLRALAKRQEEMQMPLDAGEDEAPPPHY